MLLVYTPNITSRIEYIVSYVLGELVGVKYVLTSDLDFFKKQEDAKISYAPNSESSNHIYSHSLLFETGVKQFDVPINKDEELPKLFPSEVNAFLNFDVFAASFYMISRYEEYLPFKADKHGRFTSDLSKAGKHNFLHKPVVNLWAAELKNKLQETFSSLEFKERKFQFINTFDIDNAYAYLGKGFLRNHGAWVRASWTRKFSENIERVAVWRGKRKDPYDTYDTITTINKKYNLNSIVFFLLGNYSSFDKNLSHKTELLQELIKRLSKEMKIGIHPSYKSNRKPKQIAIEKQRLENILGESITSSRQHYLKLSFPSTYRNLIINGIKEDYTLCYADDWGFRAGTCVPFYFYDLSEELITHLKLFPTTIMEATFRYYLGYRFEKTSTEIEKAIDEVYNVNGTFISLWHNESLSENSIWKGWSNIYFKMIDYVTQKA
ncbi:MAG: hypothetical protein HKO56_08335 [Bacteroidia bacterium]|nr:polysaccharide deacetylase family protein [Bacteroidia bacterium]NNC85470.1 hypothetical protein [Bacteroidia bacterium]NNM16651.1 hypothetical protein [Bacteroidia bacterium]